MTLELFLYLYVALRNLLRHPRRRRFIRWLFKIGEAQEYPPLALALRWVLCPIYSLGAYLHGRPVDWVEVDFMTDQVKLCGVWYTYELFESWAAVPEGWTLIVEKKGGHVTGRWAK